MSGASRSALAVLLAVVVLLTGACAVAAGRSSPGLVFGVLGAQCTPGRAQALVEAGVSWAEIRVPWEELEPADGVFDAAAEARLQDAVVTCRDAGLGIVFNLGLQSAPPWVAGLAGGSYRSQRGASGPTRVPNIVFSAAVREAVRDFGTRLASLVPFDDLVAFRIGTSEAGELGYPLARSGADYWAFDEAAQTGAGLAAGAVTTPMPGWQPGSASWRGRPVTAIDAGQWFSWYSDAVTRAVLWQIALVRELGFRGEIHLPLAGRGALPDDLRAAVAGLLGGSGERDGSLERGLFYPDQLRRIAQAPAVGRVVADVTGLDDSTAVQARRLVPPEDSCRPGDASLDLRVTPGLERWSGFRWTVANARQNGLPVLGENPGSPSAPGTGADEDSDPLAEQMRRAPRYAASCGLTALLWAFEDDLFGPDEGGTDLAAYAAQIHRHRVPVGGPP